MRSLRRSPSKWIRNVADEKAAARGCYFEEAAALHVVDFFRRFLRHSKGEWAGQPFELLDWQRDEIIYPLFGWKRADGTRRFRKAYVELPKKNGKSTIASGIGLYMLVGDGEAGAEVYSAATDQKQAGIVHGEAINMVDASDELSSVLNINRTTSTISYPETKSVYRALSAEAEGKEGLNASCIIQDEKHVWKGRKLHAALKYAFRSRRQGLNFAITTAGDDVTSVCYEEHEYALGVLDGTIEDDRFFAYIRAAQPEDDITDPAVWHKANPSLGITIKLDEFAADVKEAQKSPSGMAELKRYSFNIWTTSTNPWFNPGDWMKCRESYTEDDLLGLDCYGGVDLSKTRDMTALVLCFPISADVYRQLVYCWLPEGSLEGDGPNVAKYRAWKEAGWLEVMPGDVCDYGFIKRRIIEVGRKFRLRETGYDPYRADVLMQQMRDEDDLKAIEFPQTINQFAHPCDEYERLVISGGMKHNGHPIFAWQAGHVQVKTDANGNKRPVKPPHNDPRKIDAIVSAVQALDMAMRHGGKKSVYETRGLVVV